MARKTETEAVHKPWYQAGIRFQCTGGGKCCHSHGEYDRVYINDRETREIAHLLGMSQSEFERTHCFFEDGQRLLTFTAGACIFLEGTRCRIYEARPVQCRTWPFWPENLKKKVWDEQVRPFCPGVGRGPLVSREEIERSARHMAEG